MHMQNRDVHIVCHLNINPHACELSDNQYSVSIMLVSLLRIMWGIMRSVCIYVHILYTIGDVFYRIESVCVYEC